MASTTIKLEDDLYAKVGGLKAPQQSATAYVRALIEREYSQRQQAAAAEAYQSFLAANPSEREELATWETAPLAEAPTSPPIS